MQFLIPLRKRLLMLLLAFIACYCACLVISALLAEIFDINAKVLNIIIVLQDVLAFILPAVGTAVMCTRQPAQLLEVDRRPPLLPVVFGLAAATVSIPAMDWVIGLNQQLPLPEGMRQAVAEMEQGAAEQLQMMFGAHGIGSFIMSILVIGVMAALSEEMLFRGAFQRIMQTGGVNAHAAIWVAAIVFSAAHMQFYGFVPRMLLGAFFGYSLLWTRSLWVPIILHFYNNAQYIVNEFYGSGESSLDGFTSMRTPAIILSAVLTAACLALMHRACRKANAQEA